MSPSIKDFLQCVNCGIKLNHVRRQWVAEENEESQQLLTDWICKELEDNEALCFPCCSLLHSALESENKSRRFGHKVVCFSCGVSINKTRKSPRLDTQPEYKVFITQWIPSHQVKRLEYVCWRCHSRLKRLYEKTNSGHAKDSKEHMKIKLEQLGYGEVDIPASPHPQDSSEEETTPDKHPQPHSITLNTYKRAADTSRHCIFKTCSRQATVAPPRCIKERLLIDYSFYLPPYSRICERHQINSHEIWRELVDSATITDFTAAHIDNLLSILKNTKCKFFCRSFIFQIKQDDYFCQYLLGTGYETFEKMLKDIQPIRKKVWHIQKALAMYLMKKHTGFSEEKVAKFFGVRLQMLVKIINRVHTHLESVAASDSSYAAVPTMGVGNQEEMVYYSM
ncbi:hypothetical protein PYW08_010503 [Mythimna loreyi]|uniref:Uncharacterized protein n=1 Tax=Mythimna loreyi TaxID=667449 RepID=A0ACC2Q4Z2_9NEOP|nr:hypothetical protein PYW08_010503 [Mythimna loreyi]